LHHHIEKPDKEEETASSFLKPNLGLFFWFILLAFGGGLLSLYYTTIGYFPDMKWDESLTYLMVLSILGGAVVLAYGLMIFIPGVIWSEFLVFDPYLKREFCYLGEKGREPCVMALLKRVVIPFVFFVGPIHWLPLSLEPKILAEGFFVLCFACWIAYLLNADIFPDAGFWGLGSTGGRFLAFFSLSAISAWLALGLIRWILGQESAPDNRLSIICTAMVVVANIFVALQFRKRRIGAYVSGAFAAALLVVFSHLLIVQPGQKPSARFLSAFGVGYEHKVTLLVSRRGAEILAAQGGHLTPSGLDRLPISVSLPPGYKEGEEGGEDAIQDPGFRVDGLEMLSRLGNDYLFRSPESKIAFSVPKKYVLSWSYELDLGNTKIQDLHTDERTIKPKANEAPRPTKDSLTRYGTIPRLGGGVNPVTKTRGTTSAAGIL
jgi:hypothetical protein